MPQDISGLQDHEFQTRFPEAPALLYQVRLGDEKLQVLVYFRLCWSRCAQTLYSALSPVCVSYILHVSVSQAPMGLFYPTTFGIVGQKMTSLQYRSHGDPEDPHDEHFLLATQSKQEQV